MVRNNYRYAIGAKQMPATRTRRSAQDKRQAEINLLQNSVEAVRNFIEKYPSDPYIERRRTLLENLQDKLARASA